MIGDPLDLPHVRTDPACVEHDGNTPDASRGIACRACVPRLREPGYAHPGEGWLG